VDTRRDAPSLRATQELLGGLFRRFEAIDAHHDQAVRAEVMHLVAGSDRLTPLEQAEIYREQFWLRHRDSLYEDFPALAHLLGNDAFEQLVRAYLLAHPPSSWTLRDLGGQLAEFIDGYEALAADAAAARELCRFELAFVAIFDAPEVPKVALDKVQALGADAWIRAGISFQPHLTLFSFAFPVHEYRRALRTDPEAPRAIAPRASHVALWRGTDLRVHHTELEAAEIALLRSLRQGLALGEACEAAAATSATDRDPFATRLQGWFALWAQRGWVTDVTT
jgi:hypothetical protein